MNVTERYPARDKELAEGTAPNSIEFIRKFYLDAYDRVMPHLDDNKYFVIHDAFMLQSWKDFMREEKYNNVILDTHQYLMMAEMYGCEQSLDGYLKYINEVIAKEMYEMQEHFPVICGEWCLFNSLACGCDTKGGQTVLNGMDDAKTETLSLDEKQKLYSTLADAQLKVWNKCSGHYYWNYKLLLDTVNDNGWVGWDAWDLGKSHDLKWFPTLTDK